MKLERRVLSGIAELKLDTARLMSSIHDDECPGEIKSLLSRSVEKQVPIDWGGMASVLDGFDTHNAIQNGEHRSNACLAS